MGIEISNSTPRGKEDSVSHSGKIERLSLALEGPEEKELNSDALILGTIYNTTLKSS
jgi:hypothetical protein